MTYAEFRRLAETAAADKPTQADWVAYLDAVHEPRDLLPVIDERIVELEQMVREELAVLTDMFDLIPPGDDWRASVQNTMEAARAVLARGHGDDHYEGVAR